MCGGHEQFSGKNNQRQLPADAGPIQGLAIVRGFFISEYCRSVPRLALPY